MRRLSSPLLRLTNSSIAGKKSTSAFRPPQGCSNAQCQIVGPATISVGYTYNTGGNISTGTGSKVGFSLQIFHSGAPHLLRLQSGTDGSCNGGTATSKRHTSGTPRKASSLNTSTRYIQNELLEIDSERLAKRENRGSTFPAARHVRPHYMCTTTRFCIVLPRRRQKRRHDPISPRPPNHASRAIERAMYK